jgi:hypothetical protein
MERSRHRERIVKEPSGEDGSIRKMPRCHQIAAGFGIGLLAAACTTMHPSSGPPTVIHSTPFGSSQVPTGGQPPIPPGGAPAVPPTGLTPPPANVGDRNGTYSGTASPLSTGGGACLTNQSVSGFRVDGNSVRWGRFHGTISRDNGLQMVNGNTWVFGQFVGTRFDGQISTTRGSGPGCSFIMTLEKTGS